MGTPFYVGIGQGLRLFSHEEEAKDPKRNSLKLETIRQVWSEGKEVIREIDGFHDVEPWDREEYLINEIGLVWSGTGPLTNAQVYASSAKKDGVELRKYADDHALGSVEEIPSRFKLADTKMMAGPQEPKSRTSVFGKIYTVAERNPGLTGRELVRALQNVDFTGNKSAYTQSGSVCAAWLVDYIEGAYFRNDRRHLQKYPFA
ncbi:GIY-YIG nuclease family protein [Tsuneonella troitsensis]|uniref:hypothetical protein n=1 Tax=Tsuneonella troitsensis TaxID=292222 RepID=UPI000AE22C7A|nr:hypothetical protein [Tsuneonella troitsensis]